jgi:hypothetical protein
MQYVKKKSFVSSKVRFSTAWEVDMYAYRWCTLEGPYSLCCCGSFGGQTLKGLLMATPLFKLNEVTKYKGTILVRNSDFYLT